MTLKLFCINFFAFIILNSFFFSNSFAQDSVSIIMYHRFGESSYPTTNIQMEKFKDHINELKSQKYNIMKLSKIITKNSELTYLKTAKEVEEQRSNKKNLSKYLEMLVDRVPENGWYYLELSKLLNPEIDYQRICYLLDTSIEL